MDPRLLSETGFLKTWAVRVPVFSALFQGKYCRVKTRGSLKVLPKIGRDVSVFGFHFLRIKGSTLFSLYVRFLLSRSNGKLKKQYSKKKSKPFRLKVGKCW